MELGARDAGTHSGRRGATEGWHLHPELGSAAGGAGGARARREPRRSQSIRAARARAEAPASECHWPDAATPPAPVYRSEEPGTNNKLEAYPPGVFRGFSKPKFKGFSTFGCVKSRTSEIIKSGKFV